MGKRCIVFAVGVEHSLSIMREYLAAGISAEHIDGKTPKGDREAILNRLRTGETQVLCNCAIVTEGFDLPAAEVVQLARPTQSVALYLQMVGRVLRPLDGKRAIILDHGGLIEAHGFPSDHRNWTLKGVETKKSIVKQEGDGRLVVDEEATENEEKVKREIEILKEQKLYKLTEAGKAETLVLKLVAQQKYKGYKPIWVMYRLIENHRNVLTIEHFKCLEKHLGYRRGWHKHKWNEFQDSLANA
jgi:superfamily II DNA or RNA helicase